MLVFGGVAVLLSSEFFRSSLQNVVASATITLADNFLAIMGSIFVVAIGTMFLGVLHVDHHRSIRGVAQSPRWDVFRALNYVAVVMFVSSLMYIMMNYRLFFGSKMVQTDTFAETQHAAGRQNVVFASGLACCMLAYFFGFFGISLVSSDVIDEGSGVGTMRPRHDSADCNTCGEILKKASLSGNFSDNEEDDCSDSWTDGESKLTTDMQRVDMTDGNMAKPPMTMRRLLRLHPEEASALILEASLRGSFSDSESDGSMTMSEDGSSAASSEQMELEEDVAGSAKSTKEGEDEKITDALCSPLGRVEFTRLLTLASPDEGNADDVSSAPSSSSVIGQAKQEVLAGLHESPFVLIRDQSANKSGRCEMQVWKRVVPDCPVLMVKVRMVLHVPAAVVLLHVTDPEQLMSWSAPVKQYRTIARDGDCDVVYGFYSFPRPLGDRDMVEHRAMQWPHENEASAHVVAFSSCAHPDAPEETCAAVRGETLLAGYVLRELGPEEGGGGGGAGGGSSSNSNSSSGGGRHQGGGIVKEEDLNVVREGVRTEVVFISHSDIKGAIPKYLVNSFAANAAVDMCTALATACGEYMKQ